MTPAAPSPSPQIEVNGTSVPLAQTTTLASVVIALLKPAEAGATVASLGGGIAAAVNDAVVPRSIWADHTLNDGDRVEILTAVQGG
ncbi:sulfur carrier protein ThiS [Lysinibacter cavernae]|uniref:Sulfur carrier protein n=1 Tax=Lysinibacter cavernae TaxID=1640652 RepID=A0A7X5TTX2_9MICO|nr:sulfur carrier protein ThiS [Lysinibacter cavernae]NIH53062.1 sulfur carrier protein [Lysinibacter cavernae]